MLDRYAQFIIQDVYTAVVRNGHPLEREAQKAKR
jgi:hypothetical protein